MEKIIVLLLFCVLFHAGISLSGENAPEDMKYEKVPLNYPSSWLFPAKLEIDILNSDSKPIPDAKFILSFIKYENFGYGVSSPSVFSREFTSDVDGKIEISPDDFENHDSIQLKMEVRGGGNYIPFVCTIERAIGKFGEIVETEIPAKWAFCLEKGEFLPIRFSGLDEKEYENLQCECAIHNGSRLMPGFTPIQNMRAASTFECKADSKGDALLGPLPTYGLKSVVITCAHPIFDRSTHFLELEFIEGKYKPMEIEFGSRIIRGRVLDPEGKGIHGAVIAGDLLPGDNTFKKRVETDENGDFKIGGHWCSNRSPITLKIYAPGMNPVEMMFEKTPNDPISIPMKPTENLIRIKTVDDNGDPIKRFSVIPYIIPSSRITAFLNGDKVLYGDGTWEWYNPPVDEYYFTARLMPEDGEKNVRTLSSEKPFCIMRAQKEAYTIKFVSPDSNTVHRSARGRLLPDRIGLKFKNYETDEPLPGVKVDLKLKNARGFQMVTTWQSDSEGKLGLDFGDFTQNDREEEYLVSLEFEKDGFESKTLNWVKTSLYSPGFYRLQAAAAVPPHVIRMSEIRHLDNLHGSTRESIDRYYLRNGFGAYPGNEPRIEEPVFPMPEYIEPVLMPKRLISE